MEARARMAPQGVINRFVLGAGAQTCLVRVVDVPLAWALLELQRIALDSACRLCTCDCSSVDWPTWYTACAVSVKLLLDRERKDGMRTEQATRRKCAGEHCHVGAL